MPIAQIQFFRFQITDSSPRLGDLVQMPILVHHDFLGSPLLGDHLPVVHKATYTILPAFPKVLYHRFSWTSFRVNHTFVKRRENT